MAIAEQLERYLKSGNIVYSEIEHDKAMSTEQLIPLLGIPGDHILVSTPVIDQQGVTFVIHAAISDVDIHKLNKALHRNFQLLTAKQTSRLFKDCEDSEIPALPNAYGLPVVIDQQLMSLQHAWLKAGSRTSLIKLGKKSLHSVLQGLQSHDCVTMAFDPAPIKKALQLDAKPIQSLEDVARRLQTVYSLPPMPAIAVKIMHLVTDPDSTVEELVGVIEQDPSLAAQIMRYARSALFNFPGKIETVNDAVTIVLGFERVANISMGLAAKRAFKLPDQGPIGLTNFWRHSLYTAFLCQQFALQLPSADGVSPGTAYLAGLLHNFGLLLMGEVFTPEYMSLSQLMCEHPESPVSMLEKQVFGMGWAEDVISLGHGTIGGVLLKLWGLPEAIVKSTAMHQVPHYEGEHASYVKLVQLSNVILSEIGIGEKDSYADAESLFIELGFNPDAGREIAAEALKYTAELNQLADELAA